MRRTTLSMLKNRQQGIVLVVVLIMLMLIALLGATAMRTATFNEKIAVNHQHKNLAFQAAENALSQALMSDPDDITPSSTTPNTDRSTSDFFVSRDIGGQPDMSADLAVTFVEQRNNVVLSGYRFNANALIYTLKSAGEIDGTATRSVNRIGAALLR